eukprot:TRINITY_DN5569_c0_g1_i1.p1 TRINITY_DN5569_c0_g1~~TRINITY_DN5569_c0_g1_i1.p1  ORF type:complete len:606 (+),score=108.60 TRINITY_DN5569_c0_g1_i1:715-2532(+)
MSKEEPKKYKTIIKVKKVTDLPDTKSNYQLVIETFFYGKYKEENLRSVPVTVRDSECVFRGNEGALKVSSKFKESDSVKDTVNFSLFQIKGSKEKKLGSCSVSMVDYVPLVEEGEIEKFNVKKVVTYKKKQCISVDISIKVIKQAELRKIPLSPRVGTPKPKHRGLLHSSHENRSRKKKREVSPNKLRNFNRSQTVKKLGELELFDESYKLSSAKKYPTAEELRAGRVVKRELSHKLQHSDSILGSYCLDDFSRVRREKAVKYLVENLIPSGPLYESNVVPYICAQSLIYWKSFSCEDDLKDRIIESFEQQIINISDISSSLRLLSKICGLYYYIHEYLSGLSENTDTAVQFLERVKEIVIISYSNVLNITESELREPATLMFETLLSSERDVSTINPSSVPGVDEIKKVLSRFFEFLYSNIKIEGVKQQLEQHCFGIFTKLGFSAMQSNTTTYGKGLALKMVVSHIEEWVQSNPSTKDVPTSQYIAPLLEAMNILCFPSKRELTRASLRGNVWPSLSPDLVVGLLESYNNDDFDPVPLPDTVIEEVRKLPSKISASGMELYFEKIDWSKSPWDQVEIPEVLLELPAFSFLKSKLDSDDIDEESW